MEKIKIKILLLFASSFLFIQCADNILEDASNSTSNYVNNSKVVNDFKNWVYNNYIEISNVEKVSIFKKYNKTILKGNLNWNELSLFEYNDFYIINIPLFNYNINTSLENDMNPNGYADLSISYNKKTNKYSSSIVEIHPDKKYLESKNLYTDNEIFIDYRKVKSTDLDFSGYVFYKNIDETKISLYRLINGEKIN